VECPDRPKELHGLLATDKMGEEPTRIGAIKVRKENAGCLKNDLAYAFKKGGTSSHKPGRGRRAMSLNLLNKGGEARRERGRKDTPLIRRKGLQRKDNAQAWRTKRNRAH